jgi:hypothetical protein
MNASIFPFWFFPRFNSILTDTFRAVLVWPVFLALHNKRFTLYNKTWCRPTKGSRNGVEHTITHAAQIVYIHTYIALHIIFFPEGGVGPVPKLQCLLTLAYYAFPRRYEFRERILNYIVTGENRRTRRKTCPSATLSTTNPTWIDQDANPGLRGERPATNDLSHGTANAVQI